MERFHSTEEKEQKVQEVQVRVRLSREVHAESKSETSSLVADLAPTTPMTFAPENESMHDDVSAFTQDPVLPYDLTLLSPLAPQQPYPYDSLDPFFEDYPLHFPYSISQQK